MYSADGVIFLVYTAPQAIFILNDSVERRMRFFFDVYSTAGDVFFGVYSAAGFFLVYTVLHVICFWTAPLAKFFFGQTSQSKSA